jgi:ABC-type bacteriocin/lantibiotic exporter with double-glycine peptidase domain
VSPGELTQLLREGRDAVSTEQVIEIVSYFGAACVRISPPVDEVTMSSVPILVRVNRDTWQVILKANTKSITIIDPVLGKRILPASQYRWEEAVQIVRPKTPLRKQRQRPFAFKFVASVLREIRPSKSVGLMTVATLLLQILSLSAPFLIRLVTDNLLPFRDERRLQVVGVGIACIVLLYVLCTYLRATAVHQLKKHFDYAAIRGSVKRILFMPPIELYGYSQGEILSAIGGVTAVRRILTDFCLTCLLDGSLVITYVVWLFTLDRRIALSIGAIGLLEALVMLSTHKHIQTLTRASSKATATQTSRLLELIGNSEYIRSTGSTEVLESDWAVLLENELEAQEKLVRINALLGLFAGICNIGCPLFALWMGAFHVLDHEMSVGTLLSIVAIVGTIFGPLANFINAVDQIRIATAGLDYLEPMYAASNAPSPPPAATHSPPLLVEGHVSLRDVTVRYAHAPSPTFSSVFLDAYPGEITAITGPSGSGKTTLLRLMLGLLEPEHGGIFVDGVRRDTSNFDELRPFIGLVSQDVVVVNGSIADNIRIGVEDAAMIDVVRAAELAALANDVSAMPLQYETNVGHGGRHISGGQKQRIAFARALLRKPRILLLDEATNSLDPASESQIMKTLAELRITVILITHSLNSIQYAHRVYRMSHGTLSIVDGVGRLSVTAASSQHE